VLRTAFYFIPSVMTGFIVSVIPFRNRVSSKEAFEGLELGEGKLSRPVLRGLGGRKAAWLLGSPKVKSCRHWSRIAHPVCSVQVGRPHSTEPRSLDVARPCHGESGIPMGGYSRP